MGLSVRMKDFLKQHDFVYEKAAGDWNRAAPLANGELGAMLWGDGKPLILTLDRYDLWDTRRRGKQDWSKYNYANLRKMLDEGANNWQLEPVFGNGFWSELYHKGQNQTRLTPGRMEVEFAGKPVGFAGRLDLHRAVMSGTLSFEKGKADYRCFVDAVRDVIVLDIQMKNGAAIRRIDIPPSAYKFPNMHYPEPETGRTGDVRWRRQRQPGNGAVGGENPTGGEYAVAVKVVRSAQGDRQTIYVSIASRRAEPTDGGAVAEAVARLEEAAAMGYEQLLKEHAAWWAGFWEKSFLTIPDAQMENLYYAELYKLACQSRIGHTFMSGQGVWVQDNQAPGWSAQYCFDMNAQMDTWPAFAANHLELVVPYSDLMWRWFPVNREMGEKFFGVEGAAMLTSGVDYDGYEVPGALGANLWPGCGPWACKSLWDYYLYSEDKEFLRERAFPMMKAYMRGYFGVLEKREDGKWHIPWSSSPEYGDPEKGGWGPDDAGNLAIIRWFAKALLRAQEALGMEDEDAARWRDIGANIADLPTGKVGLEVWPGIPLKVSHRHHTHLMAIYPLEEVNAEQGEEARKVIAESLQRLTEQGFAHWCGFSAGWAAALAARGGLPERALGMLRLYADTTVMENSFQGLTDVRGRGFFLWNHPLYTPEGGLAWAAALLEMLLQSWNGVIRIFPAMPASWGDAAYDRLRTEGAFLVSARRKKGATTWVRIESEAGGSCVVRNPFGGAVRLKDEKTGKERRLSGEVLRFATQKGGVYILTAWADEKAGKALPKFRRDGGRMNWFGVKQVARF